MCTCRTTSLCHAFIPWKIIPQITASCRLEIFGHGPDNTEQPGDDIVYINWLNMVRAGVLGLQYYSPEAKKWGQAHMQARFVILQVCPKH